ncbi:hypothetical protein [Mucilaginibacter jinjuensis]|uniref:Uncharacterized protein n=1 Tax=Mucilaginibacter jinjuensis TaxID=1176721 RepID=A0ABY7T3D7_9SPHI|nr:hypothetical protein [Mucilaginibacter jinjuensis]WCT10841.1 hypothetical protein PQO05_19070 [Mucilaginibacter jinjuensis]
MKLKLILLAVIMLGINVYGKSQNLSAINVAVSGHGTSVSSVELFAGNKWINISLKGRVSFQTQGDNSTNNTQIAYYDQFDGVEKTGKAKSVDNIGFDYYDRFDDDVLRGKLKQAGKLNFTYYDRFDAAELRGKIKSIGNINVTYYDKFDMDNVGKVKNIGNTKIVYYDRFDPVELRGKIKSIQGDSPTINVIGDY